VWRFRPAGAAALNHPSLALPLPNGNILVNDDHNDRVIVISRRRTGSSGSTVTTESPAAPLATWTTPMASTWHRRTHC